MPVRHSFAVGLVAVVALSAPAAAQTKFTMSGKCAKPDVQQAVPSGEAPDHLMTLTQGKCTPVKAAEIAGSPSKEATFTEHGELKGNTGKVSGMYVETLANGEKVFYRYEATAAMANGALQTMSNTWQIVGGSGALKGIKGKGTCTGKGQPEGGLSFECSGEYTAPPK
jgi:hypothetical protein